MRLARRAANERSHSRRIAETKNRALRQTQLHVRCVKTSLFLLLAALVIHASGWPLCAAENAAPSGPEGVEWVLREMHGKLVAPAGERGLPTLKLDAAKKNVSGFSGVNRFFGGYERKGDKLKFGALAGTMMAGPPEEMATETAFHTALGNVTHWRVSKSALDLLQGEKVLLHFTAGAAAK